LVGLDLFMPVGKEALIALAGAAFAWSLKRVVLSYRNSVLNRKYGLTGEYLSRYEDTEPGKEKAWRKARTLLQQKGDSVVGSTTDLVSNRTWKLDLRIVQQKYLLGSYENEDPTDPGTGVVFLDILLNGQLEGLWAGYDPVNKSVQMGRYLFAKSLPVAVKPLTPERLPYALALFGTCLGERYITRDQLEAYAKDKDKKGFIAIDSRGGVLGAVICEIWNSAPATGEKIAALVPDLAFHKCGFLKSLAVKETQRGRGVGLKLASAALGWMRSNGSTTEIAVAWVENGRCNARGVLENLGFKEQTKIDRFWYQESKEKGYICPSCGNPCECAALVFRR
jgi:ribosomal protein S18 acetylase RimI-like enzyme